MLAAVSVVVAATMATAGDDESNGGCGERNRTAVATRRWPATGVLTSFRPSENADTHLRKHWCTPNRFKNTLMNLTAVTYQIKKVMCPPPYLSNTKLSCSPVGRPLVKDQVAIGAGVDLHIH